MPQNSPLRWQQRLQSFRRAYEQLAKGTALAKERKLSELEQQGLIHTFEFTHELAWKTVKDFLEARGVASLYGSRDTTREAFSAGLVEDGEVWMQMIDKRNLTSHTYHGETADQIASVIVEHYSGEF